MGGRGRGGAEACRLPQPCGPQTDPLGPAPFPPASPPSPTAPGVSVPGTGVVGVSSPHCRGQETEAQRWTPPHPRSCWDQGVGGGPSCSGLQGTGEPGGCEPKEGGGNGTGRVPAFDLDTAFPTSYVEVGGGGVAHAGAVGRHALIFALVRLLAALDLQGPWGERGESLASQGGPGPGPGRLSQSPAPPVSCSV